MVEPVGDNLFEAISLSLLEFRQAVEGEPGRKLRTIKGVQGPITDLIRGMLQAFYSTLLGFEKLMAAAESQLVAADAMLAGMEVGVATIRPITRPEVLTETADALGLPAEPFEQTARVLGELQGLMAQALKWTEVIPSPETARAIRAELTRLLGEPGREQEGSYRNLLSTLGTELTTPALTQGVT